MQKGSTGITVRIHRPDGPVVGIDPERDTMIVAERDGKILGMIAVRLAPFVHQMEIEPGMLSRRVADALLQYAQGYVRASRPTEAFFVVAPDNDPMHRWLQEHGAILEDPSNLYMMEVK